MITKRILFKDHEELREFLLVAQKMPFDIDVRVGSYLCDAKSVVGVLNLPTCDMLKVQFHCDEDTDLKEFNKWVYNPKRR